MKGSDNRHSQFAQECQDVTTGGPSEDAELVLQADDVHVADVEEVRGTQIGRQVLLLNLKANHFRVLVATRNVVDRHRQALALGMRAGDGGQQVGRERSDAAFARQVVSDESDFVDFRNGFHPVNPMLRVGRQAGNGADPSGFVVPGNSRLGKVASL